MSAAPTGAMNRYPRRASVSMNRGFSAESPHLLARHHLARVLEQHRQQPEWLLLKLELDAAAAKLARIQIELERAEPDA
jgi:hypothetical protein